MIDRDVFGSWLTAFGDRFGKPLGREAAVAYYVELTRRLDTTERFEAAAIRVFGTHTFNTWPAVEEFVTADRELRRDADAAMRLTLARIDDARRLAPRAGDTAHKQAVDEFARSWRAALTGSAPDDAHRAPLPAEWRTEPGVPEKPAKPDRIDFRQRAAGDR